MPILLLSYLLIAFFCVLYIPFAVNLKHFGAISLSAVASGFVSPTLACTEVLFGFPSGCRTVYNCFLPKLSIYALTNSLNLPNCIMQGLFLISRDHRSDTCFCLKQYLSVNQKNLFSCRSIPPTKSSGTTL